MPCLPHPRKSPPARFFLCCLLLVCLFPCQAFSRVAFSPSDAERRFQARPPLRIVSLVPSITETLYEIGAGDTVAGVTIHDTWPPGVSGKAVVGGFFAPVLERIFALNPDLIIVADLHDNVRKAAAGQVPVLTVTTDSLADGLENMKRLGALFHRSQQAEALVRRIGSQLALTAQKVGRIPDNQRKRVIRLMGRDRVMAPGDDSFQNDLIRAAGGIPPRLQKNGQVVEITKGQWTAFNPQVIYGCGDDRKTARNLLRRPGWEEVEAVKNHRIFYFPCELTCRVSPNTGAFVAWLTARIYPEQMGGHDCRIQAAAVTGRRPIDVDLPWVQRAEILSSQESDFTCKTLVVDFKAPMTVVSTLEGERRGMLTVGNHYKSMPAWVVNHATEVPVLKKKLCRLLGKDPEASSFLFTGADMDHLSVQRQQFREMVVYALVTAGVTSNAQRMGKDTGLYYEPGTINIFILTNMELTPRAMTRAIISATEAKTAALDDMDIRSSFTPKRHGATGTGTDNVLVVQGRGADIDNAGGHSKMGELVARAVFSGVRQAVFMQNGIASDRHIFRRLQERGVSVQDISGSPDCSCTDGQKRIASAVEEVLMDPAYAGFLSAAMAVSDSREKGLVSDLGAFNNWALAVAGQIAGRPVPEIQNRCDVTGLPEVLRTALDAILTGTIHRLQLDNVPAVK